MTMIRGEIPPPVRHSSTPGDRRCEIARAKLSDLIAQKLRLEDEPSLREHLKLCLDCNSLYRSSLLEDARLRRTMLDCAAQDEADGESAPRPRRAVLSPLAIARAGFAASAGPGRGKAGWVIVLAVVFYAVVRLTPAPSGSSRAMLEALVGKVIALDEPLAVGAGERELKRGDWVRIPEGARARLCFGESTVELASSTEVQIEEPSSQRLRLESGSLDVIGPLFVTSQYGIVHVEGGHATLTIDRRGLFVESTDGNVRTIDSLGEHELASGESAQLAFAR
jgi:hypothetical protein